MKKFVCIALALVMVLGLATTALAADTFTVELRDSTSSPRAGHEFTVYQIFTGSMAVIDGEDVLGEVKYGANYGTAGNAVPQADLDAITDAADFAKSLISGNLLHGSYGVLNEGNSWKLTAVPAGYYLIVDTTEDLPDYHSRSSYIVEVVGDVEITPKNTTSTFEKKVKDINDSEDAVIDDNDWHDSADHDIGDTIPYQITASFSDMADADKFAVEFEDIMSKGLAFNKDLTVSMTYSYIDGEGQSREATKDVTAAFPVVESAYTGTEAKYKDGKVYTLECDDVKALVEENITSARFVVSYTCTLDEDAVTGEPGNPNKAKLKFDREPDSEGEGEGETPWDVCIVFTFKTDVKKVDEKGEKLLGAEFTLEKFVANEAGTETFKGVKGVWEAIDKVEGTDGDLFSFNGLDDGRYRLTETVTPAGYNPIEPIYFTVTAAHQVEADDPQLTNLQATATKNDGTAYTEEEVNDGNVASFVITKLDGKMETSVENRAGAELPETGGVGTTIFYILGAALAVCAVVVLVTRRRMTAEG